MENQPIPIDDDEILFRRIPVSMGWYADGLLSGEAFEPRPDEYSGISVYRKRFRSLEEVAQGKSKHGYYVVSLRVSNLRYAGINVEPRPAVLEGWDDAHAELPQLNAGTPFLNSKHLEMGPRRRCQLSNLFRLDPRKIHLSIFSGGRSPVPEGLQHSRPKDRLRLLPAIHRSSTPRQQDEEVDPGAGYGPLEYRRPATG